MFISHILQQTDVGDSGIVDQNINRKGLLVNHGKHIGNKIRITDISDNRKNRDMIFVRKFIRQSLKSSFGMTAI